MLNQLIGRDIADVAGLVAADTGVIGRLISVEVFFQFGFNAVDAELPTGEIWMAVTSQFEL